MSKTGITVATIVDKWSLLNIVQLVRIRYYNSTDARERRSQSGSDLARVDS